MRWEDAPFVKLYRDTGPFMDLSLEARGLFDELLKVVDRAGILRLGADPVRTVARAVNGRPERVKGYLEELTRDGCVTVRDGALLIRNYIEAQSAKASDRARQHESRSRARDLLSGEEVGEITVPVSRVSHTVSHGVTHTSRSEEKRLEETRREEREKESAPTGASSLLGDPDNKKQKKNVDQFLGEALEILAALNAARSRLRSTSRGIRPTYSSLGGIAARLASGRTLEECLYVVAAGEAECIRKADSFDWFDTVTPWRPENFEKRLASDVSVTRKKASGLAPPIPAYAQSGEEPL